MDSIQQGYLLGNKVYEKSFDRSDKLDKKEKPGEAALDGFKKADNDGTVVTKEHVKAFAPLLKQDPVPVEVPEAHEKLIGCFKTLREHGISVVGTESPEGLKKVLENLSPTGSKNMLMSSIKSALMGDTSYATLNIGQDAKISLPLDKVTSLAEGLKNPNSVKVKSEMSLLRENGKTLWGATYGSIIDKSEMSLLKSGAVREKEDSTPGSENVRWLKDLTSKGGELYLELPDRGALGIPGYSLSATSKVKVSPEVFYWFMNNTSYSRNKSPMERAMETSFPPLMTGVALGSAISQLLPVREEVVRGGYIDATPDGKLDDNALKGGDWKSFKKVMNSLSEKARNEESWQKQAELGFMMYSEKQE